MVVRIAGSPSADRGLRERARGLTLAEVLVSLAIACLALGILYGLVSTFLRRDGKTSVSSMMDRAMTQKDLRIGLRKLMLRIGEGTEVLSPKPGFSDSTLVFRDILNQEVRLAVDGSTGTLRSARREGSGFVAEVRPQELRGDEGAAEPVARPVEIEGCTNVCFTTLSPSCVVVSLSVGAGTAENALLTAVHLRNFNIALRGEAR